MNEKESFQLMKVSAKNTFGFLLTEMFIRKMKIIYFYFLFK